MKLRNKKTGEIVIADITRMVSGVEFECGQTLAELNEEWEDYEEPKEFWCITGRGNIHYLQDITDENDKEHREIGNYFEAKEEAEKAVEKLKAWKRLKDKGFRFDRWDENHHNLGIIEFSFAKVKDNVRDFQDDLDLLFGGENE